MALKSLKILYFCNGSGVSPVKCGGGTRIVEIIKRLPISIQITIVGTKGDKLLFENEKIKRPYNFVLVKTLFKKEKNRLDRMLGYIISTLHSLFLIPNLAYAGIVYSPSDLFCDIIPGFIYKLINKSKWIVISHHLCPPPWKRKGNFLLNSISFVSQRLSFFIIGLKADKILVYNSPQAKNIIRIIQKTSFKKLLFKKVVNGVNFKMINSISQQKLVYDGLFIGGFRASKGIFDLIDIWQQVINYLPQAKLAIVGQGSADVANKLKTKIKKMGLNKNIILTGYLDQLKLYQLMKSSKIYLNPSYEEGWGIIIREALAASLPVISYNLPIISKKSFKEVTLIPIGNKKAFAKMILTHLNKKAFYKKKKKEVAKRKKDYPWTKIVSQEIRIFNNAL
ncbi:hypothetical protein COT75_05035 [Candidatus Beckwithbacteria bacterium CG10_big_fil_rev_8_21_14_0_10_34_10]|uniref:Glycosyl transferase family 1 domain-containing protein n=1 Tax=Candidatus Beckwithbacteria bacterium CG10_big_fil_rev_8_21_14_0_10_34_10 TaxID=1974495 RepID=A0A2H0W8C2_9BACT|nr:MAG: hypothetical protein COT75_05035 [Candidatus Beckwithbacteria bacterium CG10_big_fil_rev_8_21_14_0_10_34_10]